MFWEYSFINLIVTLYVFSFTKSLLLEDELYEYVQTAQFSEGSLRFN